MLKNYTNVNWIKVYTNPFQADVLFIPPYKWNIGLKWVSMYFNPIYVCVVFRILFYFVLF